MNIVLIGMPGCGKSTIGVLLAKSLLLNFVDTDLEIQNKYNQSLCEIIESYGLEGFKKIENQVISSMDFNNSVIATGGSAVYGREAMNKLKANGKVVYLKLPVNEIERRITNIKTRGIVMNKGTTISDVYFERSGLYDTYADLTVDCSGLSPEGCVEAIISAVND